MSDINLLQSTKTAASQNDRLIRILNIAGISLLALAVIFSFVVFFGVKGAESNQANLAKQASDEQSSIQSVPAYPLLLADQTKVKNLKILLDKHLDWSTLLPDFFNVTLQSASYSKFLANKDGGATITGNVPDFQELDKLLQALQFDDGSGKTYVNDVKLLNIGVSNDQAKQGVTFSIGVTFDKNLLKMQPVQVYSNAVPGYVPVQGNGALPNTAPANTPPANSAPANPPANSIPISQ
jgi:hypothetical protein